MTDKAWPLVETRVARAGYREHGFCGQRVYAELMGRESLTSLIALAVSGRRFDRDEAAMLDDVAVCWTIADPRIWPLKTGRLVASYGGCLQGMAAMLLTLDNPYVGTWKAMPVAANTLLMLRQELGEGATRLDEVRGWISQHHPGRGLVPGFGVPFRTQDERVAPLRAQVQARGRAQGTYWRLFELLERAVAQDRQLAANVAGACAAVLLDLGLQPEQMPALAVALGTHMFVANAREEAAQGNRCMQDLGHEKIDYVGTAPRRSPRCKLSRDDDADAGGSNPTGR